MIIMSAARFNHGALTHNDNYAYWALIAISHIFPLDTLLRMIITRHIYTIDDMMTFLFSHAISLLLLFIASLYILDSIFMGCRRHYASMLRCAELAPCYSSPELPRIYYRMKAGCMPIAYNTSYGTLHYDKNTAIYAASSRQHFYDTPLL